MDSKKSVKARLREVSVIMVQNQRLSSFSFRFAITKTSFSPPTPILLRYNGHVTLYVCFIALTFLKCVYLKFTLHYVLTFNINIIHCIQALLLYCRL